eukprot:CAMPEP_0172300110 /NCGR_PEP_ID=MMETSP1058-20130122/2282_1 /TAXON_ID=83371 /ORGANISM="Detonula confervacea, Strain CCMP 353" /LENGTH=32 /DNA_ID= /DNA_START= /DNA_END= /DNA_ORIENTATION=
MSQRAASTIVSTDMGYYLDINNGTLLEFNSVS